MLSALLNSFASVESVDWTECVVKCESLYDQDQAEVVRESRVLVSWFSL